MKRRDVLKMIGVAPAVPALLRVDVAAAAVPPKAELTRKVLINRWFEFECSVSLEKLGFPPKLTTPVTLGGAEFFIQRLDWDVSLLRIHGRTKDANLSYGPNGVMFPPELVIDGRVAEIRSDWRWWFTGETQEIPDY